jgi:hypothetical protein
VTTNLSRVVTECSSASAQNDACAQQFINDFANRAFRGQFDSDEGTSLFQNVYAPIQKQFDFATGIQAVITSVLTSPRFLYVLEFGQPSGAGKVVQLSPNELATRLSLFLWRSLPDGPLLMAAANNQLSTPEQIKTQAARMLQDPKALTALDDFTTQWMELESATSLTRDSQYGAWNENQRLAAELAGEALATFHFTALDPNGSLTELLTSTSSYVNQDVKDFYSLPGPLSANCSDPSNPTCFQKTNVSTASNPRAGILTDAIVLAAQSHTSFPSPTLRGKLVREQVLCDAVQPPPTGLKIPPPPTTVPAGQTIKQQYAVHGVGGCGSGCHDFMDKIGNGFGMYDATGTYQTTEADGHANPDGGAPLASSFPPIDPSGEVAMFAHGEFSASFSGAVDLVTQLAKSTQAQQCFALEEFRYALDRVETLADACSVQQIFRTFSSNQLNIQQLLLAVVQSDGFRYRTVETAGSACQ